MLAESVREPAEGPLGSHGVLYFIVSVLTESIREPAEGPLGSHGVLYFISLCWQRASESLLKAVWVLMESCTLLSVCVDRERQRAC